jgi:hypothetical protein
MARVMDDIPVSSLLDERRALLYMIPRMEGSVRRAANWLVGEFAPKGPIMQLRDLSYCHKVLWGLHEAGRIEAAGRLLDWVAGNARMAPGRYYFPEEPPFNKEMQLLYRLLTIARVGEEMGHPGFANRETREAILAHQHACGGAFGNIDMEEYMGTINPLVSSFFTEWALAAGLGEPARRSADFLVKMVELNGPHLLAEPGRFYYNYDPESDGLVKEAPPGEEINFFVDTLRSKQHFYQVGTAMAALSEMYVATGEAGYLGAARRLFEFTDRLNPLGLRWPSYCKIGWGAAKLYAATGLPEHRALAANVSEATFMAAQMPKGCWHSMYYPLRDRGAWETFDYDGSETGQPPERDGSWAVLSAHEITGEFTAEMGCTLSVFKDSVQKIEERLSSEGLGFEWGRSLVDIRGETRGAVKRESSI